MMLPVDIRECILVPICRVAAFHRNPDSLDPPCCKSPDTDVSLHCLLQGASEFTYDMLSPGPSMRQKRRQKPSRRRTSNLPQDLREGVTNAYELVKEVGVTGLQRHS